MSDAKRKLPLSLPKNPLNVRWPSLSRTPALDGKGKVSSGITLVVDSMGKWFCGTINSIRTHALCFSSQETSTGLSGPKKVRFCEPNVNHLLCVDDRSSEHKEHSDSGARSSSMAVPPEITREAVPERDNAARLSSEGCELLRADYESSLSQRRLYFGGYRSQECIRSSHAANASFASSTFTFNSQAWIVDIHREFRLEVAVLTWSHWDREDTLGFRPVRVTTPGQTHGGFKVVYARPARWDSVRRHIAASVLATGINPLDGLGVAEYYERETWQYYDPRQYKEDIYLEFILRGGDPSLRSRDHGCTQEKSNNSCDHGSDVHHGERCPLMPDTIDLSGSGGDDDSESDTESVESVHPETK